MIGLSKVPVVICLLTNDYLKSPICNKEIEKTFKEEKSVILARMGLLTEENEAYLNNLKCNSNSNLKISEYDFTTDECKLNWKNLLLETINKSFHKNEDVLIHLTLDVTNQVSNQKAFKKINRLCILEEIIVIGDWESNVGIHIYNFNFEYLRTFNHCGMLKKVTGVCKLEGNKLAIVSSFPNTSENSIFIFTYINQIDFKEFSLYKDNEKDRDLCGVEFCTLNNFICVLDRLNCSVLKFDSKLKLVDEIDLKSRLPHRFSYPILRDLKIKNKFLFLTDSFSSKNHRGNNCIHVLECENFTWIKSLGEANLSSPSALFVNETATEIAVLERASQGLIKYFKFSGENFKVLKLSESVYPTNFIVPDKDCIITNDEKNMISIYEIERLQTKVCSIA